MRAVVLVEGVSDQVALEALAARRGRVLHDEGVSVVSMGGAQSIGRFITRFGPRGMDVRLAGLCDVGEERDFRRGRARPIEAQLRRFMGTRSGRKIHDARVLVEALDLTRVPRPLDQVLAHV